VPSTGIAQVRRLLPAEGFGNRTAGVEIAPGRRIGRTWQIPGEHDAFAIALADRIDQRDRIHQRFGIGVLRRCKQGLALTDLNEFAQIHDADPVADMAYDRQVV